MNTDQMHAETIAAGGGTISLSGADIPAAGFMVALGRKYGAIVAADDTGAFAEAVTELAAGGHSDLVGTWVNDNKIYLDLVENIRDRDVAVAIGELRNQVAIWDILNSEEIATGGNGE